MKILVVDDERTFTFSKDDEVVYARSISEAREFLLNEHWDEVWLDHDLGNGEDVSKLTDEIEVGVVLNNLVIDVDFWFIHSMNPVGAMRMQKTLMNLGFQVLIYPAHTRYMVEARAKVLAVEWMERED